jgi:microcystin-dependent protein
MSDPFLGEIRMFAGLFAPVGWANCNGAVVSIAQNDALFTLYGTTYGGDGSSTFGLPNLWGRVPIHDGTGPGLSPYTLGQTGGTESVSVLPTQVPGHTHLFFANTDAASETTLAGNVLGAPAALSIYYQGLTARNMGNDSIGLSGESNQPHENRMPSLAITFIVAMAGIFPNRG